MNTFQRMEKKTTIRSSDVPAFMERIAPFMLPDKHSADGKPYMICNIYFDDDNDSIIRNSVALPYYKEKLRLRSYGTPTPDSHIFLELKKKTNGVGTKRRVKMTLRDTETYLQTGVHPEGLSYIDEQVLREIDYYRSHETVYPKLYVSYLRHAFHAKDDPSFRVTLDSEILTRRYDLDLEKGRYGNPILTEGITLLEVKFSGAVPFWFARIMSEFGLSFHTFSKCGTDFKLYIHEQALADSGEHYLRLIH